MRGQQQDRQVADVPDALQHLPAVHHRQADVQYQQIGMYLMHQPQPGPAVRGVLDRVTAAAQQQGQRKRDVLIVLHHEQPAHGAPLAAKAYEV